MLLFTFPSVVTVTSDLYMDSIYHVPLSFQPEGLSLVFLAGQVSLKCFLSGSVLISPSFMKTSFAGCGILGL